MQLRRNPPPAAALTLFALLALHDAACVHNTAATHIHSSTRFAIKQLIRYTTNEATKGRPSNGSAAHQCKLRPSPPAAALEHRRVAAQRERARRRPGLRVERAVSLVELEGGDGLDVGGGVADLYLWGWGGVGGSWVDVSGAVAWGGCEGLVWGMGRRMMNPGT
jgi:hypothetical protein